MFSSHSREKQLIALCREGDLNKIKEFFVPKKGLLFGQKDNSTVDYVYFRTDDHEDAGFTPLMMAAKEGHLQVLKYFVDEKNVALGDQQDADKATPLMTAARFGKLDVVKYLVEEKTRSLKFADKQGWTPFMYACYNNNLEIVQYLAGCKKNDPEAANEDQRTSLLLATAKGHQAVVEYLIEEVKVNIEAKDKWNLTALMIASMCGRKTTVKYLIAKGAKINELDSKGRNSLVLAIVGNVGDPSCGDKPTSGSKNTFQVLVDAGADLSVHLPDGQSILSVAAENGSLDIVRGLIEGSYGVMADMNENLGKHCTPLTFACKSLQEPVVDYLIEKGASPKLAFETISNSIFDFSTNNSTNYNNSYRILNKLAFWVARDEKEAKVPVPAEGATYKVLAEPCCVRVAPELSSDIVSEIPIGTIVTVANERVVVFYNEAGGGVDWANVNSWSFGRFRVIAPTEYVGWITYSTKKKLKLINAVDGSVETVAVDSPSVVDVEVKAEMVLNPVSDTVELGVSPQVPIETQDSLTLSLALSVDLTAAFGLFSLNIKERNVTTARGARNIEGIKSALAEKKAMEDRVKLTLGNVQDLASSEFQLIEKQNIAEQSRWLLQQLDKFVEDLYACAESTEDFERVEKIEKLAIVVRKESEPVSLKSLETTNSCRVSDRVRDGKQSSGDCQIVDALYSTPLISSREVKLKLRPRAAVSLAEHEYRILFALNEANPRRFVKPYELIRGWDTSGLGKFSSVHDEDFSGFCGIVMEKGHESLSDYLERKVDLSRLEILSIAEVLVDILIAAHKVNIVLLDFKPANVVRCFDENHEVVWKAIDFDCSRLVGDGINRSITAQYGCYEVAKFALSPVNTVPPAAMKAMDICSLGWIVWKMMAKNRSLWDDLGLSNQDKAIVEKLSTLTNQDLAKHIARTFPEQSNAPLRRWLEHALDVDPLSRPAAPTLKSNYSLLGHRETTINMNSLAEKIVSDVDSRLAIHADRITNRLIDRIDDLSVEIRQQFGQLQSSLDSAAVNFAMNGDSASVDQLIGLLESQREEVQQGKLQMEDAVKQMQALNASLQSTVVQPIGKALQASDNSISDNEKLDAILDMMREMKGQLSDIQSLQRQQLSLLGEMDRRGNFLPHLFCVIPEVRIEKLDKTASRSAKAVNWLMRMSESVTRAVWSRSRLVFICPVTLQMVPCGEDGKGYVIDMPTQLIRNAVPILKIGLTLLKVALATQGLGNVIPNVADFLPSGFDMTALSNVMSDMASTVTDTVLSDGDALIQSAESASNQVASMQNIYELVAKAEGNDLTNKSDAIAKWKPKQTGLILTKSDVTGTSAWVSSTGIADFQRLGNKAFKSAADK